MASLTRFLYSNLIYDHHQGSACLGLCSKTHVVLCALKRSPHELASYQKKLLKIDEHLGVAIAGLNADARSLAKYMRTECLNHRYVYGGVMQAGRLVADVADKHLISTAKTRSLRGC